MKFFSTCLLFFISLNGFAQEFDQKTEGKITGLNHSAGSPYSAGRKTMCSVTVLIPHPLLVVDGKILPLSDLNEINPGQVDNVTILKSSASIAIYGAKGSSGTIIVTLKNMKHAGIAILDSIDNQPIPFATVTFIYKGDTLRYKADSLGRVLTNSSEELEGSEMITTATGYHPHRALWKHTLATGEKQILLHRNTIQYDPVVIYSGLHTGCRRYSCSCTRIGSIDSVTAEKMSPNETSAGSLKFFPNPAGKGSTISIIDASSFQGKGIIQVSTAQGQLVYSQVITLVKDNTIILPVQQNWSAGTYFIRLVYENGRAGASGKLIIQ